MATKKKNQLNIIGEAVLDENDKVVSKKAFIQPSKEIAPVKKTDGFFKSSDAADNWSLSTGNPMLDFIQRTNAGIWGTVFNAGTNVVRGATGSIEGVGDFAQNRVADIQDLFGFDEAAEKTRRKSEETWGVNKKIDEFNDIMNTTSILGDKSEGVFQGVGSSLLAMGTAGLGGAVSGGSQLISSIASLGTLGIGAAGSSENEARMQMMNEMKDKGYTTKQINDASRMYGLFSGTAETISEMMFGGISKASKALGIGKGLFDSADDAIINTLTKNIQGKIVKNLVQAGLKASGEGVEEVASGIMDAFAKKLTYMKDEKLIDLIKDEKLFDSFISGTLSAYITQAPSAFKSVTTRQDGKLRLQTNEEIRDFITNLNAQEQQVVEREIENRIGQEEKVSKKRRIEIEKQVIEDLDRGYINANTIRDVLGENYNAERDVRLNESFNEETRRTQAYENDVSKYDEKQRKTIQTAIDSGLLNNSNKTHDFVDLIAKLSADKGIDFDFTNNQRIKDTGFAIDGKQVNGFIKDGKIALNLESNQVLNKTVGHEITHVLEGTELYDNLQQSLKAYIGEKEWNNRISQLEKVYRDVKDANIQNELTSDLVGEHIFNDENFIRNLSTRNPNLFQKIFDEIKYMVKIATAGSKEARDLEKVKRAFEKAYRETSKIQEGTQYSISERTDNTQDVDNYIKEKGFAFKENGNLEVKDLTDKQIKDLVKLYKQTGYEDVSSDYLTERLKSGQMPIQREVADRFIEKELGYKPQYDTTKIFEDAEGNPLTKEQVEFYKDSGVRDIRGRLIPVYHRTNADFTIFDDKAGTQHGKKYGKGFYFSITPENYGNNTMKVYLNAKDGEFKYVPKMGYYIVQEANQIKNVDNKAPTSNPDIRYSLSDNGEMVDNNGNKVTLEASEEGNSGTLMVLHNLGEDKFNGVLDLGGIPVPSLAVTNPNIIDHNQFGEGTLIFDKSTIDPAVEANEVYDRDVWSPTIRDNVQIDYEINDDAIETTAEKLGIEAWRLRDAVEDNKPEYLAERLLREEKLIDKYVKDNNIKYETAYKDAETKVDMHQSGENLRKFIRDNDLTVEKISKDRELRQKYFDEIKKYYDESSFPQAVKENLYKEKMEYFDKWIDERTDIRSREDIPRGLLRYQDDFDLIKSGDNKVVDEWQTEKNKKQAAIDNGIEEYLKQQTKDVYGEKGIRNDVELFTNSGNRRSFWALHDEYNLDNLVEALTKGETTGTQHFGSGYGQIQAAMANRFNSISDIKANESLLTNLSENNEVLENAKANIDSDIEEIESNNDVYYDTVAELLVDFARGDLTIDNFKKLTRNDYQTIRNVSDSLIEKIIDDMETLKNLPTDYFEAKPQRALGLDEIQMAVIPNNWSAETKQRLTDMGIQYTEYDPSIEGDRQRVINQFDDLKFSLSQDNIAPTSGWNVRSEDVRLQSAFKETIAPLQEQVQQLTDTITRLEDRIAPLNEQEADELYQETQRGFENEVAPIRENLTEEENRRMDVLDLLERNNMLTEEQRYEREQLQNKENPANVDEEVTVGQSLEDIRDINEVGSPKVKSYQYEHPEVKPYFQQEARGMLSDLNNSQKGERFKVTSNAYDGHIIEQEEWKGVPRFTSPQIAELLDSKWGYTYKDIEKGLNAIIEDHGAENIAVAKRIEFVLDDNLRNGYTDWQTGMEVPPNQDYLNMLKEQEWENYFDDINNQYPLEQNIPQYDIENDFSDVKIEPDIQDMTEEDLNLEPFLNGLQGARERQAERQQLREELNQKREVKIPKDNDVKRGINRGLGLLVNEFAVVDDFGKQRGNKNIKFKADTYNNYQAIAQSNIETAQTDINGKAIGRSGNSIFEEAKSLGLENTFDEYLKQWANVDRAKQGKGAANYSAQESYKIVKEMEARNPELKRLGKDMWQYYRNARHNLRDAGIISQEVSDLLGRMYPHYTPYISENIENYFTDEGKLKPKQTIKRAKGGAAIGDLLNAEEAMQMYTKSQFNTIFGNDLYKEIVNTSNDIVQLGGDERGMNYVNADNLYADKDGYYLTAYENGEPITAKISEDMYRTLTRESRNRISDIENTFSAVTKPLQGLSKLRRNILTSWSPTFIFKNAIKDFQEGIFNSKYTKDFAKNFLSGNAFRELKNNTELAQQFKSLYGSGLTMGQYDIDSTNYTPSGRNKGFLQGIKNFITGANELIELAPRYAEFKASLENGTSLQEAMYNAREVTTNFSRGGTLAKALNRNGFTFLNSSIQGFDKFIRNFSGENGAKGIVNSLAKAAIFGIAPAVFNELVFGSGDDKDEEYEALPDYIKDNYYIIKTGDGNFIRIPKGRVLSVFGSAARRTLELAQGEENAFEGYLDNVQQQIGINNPEENNIFAPLLQAMGGRKLDSGQTAGSAWYGGDIIPSRLQKERPEDQYDASIDNLSIWLGQHTGISPYKINYVLDQYTGGIGDIGLPFITPEANSDGSLIAPIKDQFTADTITDNKYVSEFYDTKGKLYTGSKATDEDILKNKYMNSISTEMAKLYAERREVQASDLTKKEKYAKSQEIKAEINRLAKEGMDNYNNVIMSNNYAKIGDTEYYKNANGQWTKVTDDVASLGLDTEEKNEYYKVKNDIYTTKKENDGNDKPLVVQDIINSNLTPEAKVNLYTSNYKDDLMQPLVDSGMDVDSYLTYKSQNFTADKDSNGKSISGSKKRKVFDYINSMNIPYEQKLILAKSEYNTFNDNNTEIIEYIENSGMDYDERISLYKQLGFKVDGNNVSW